MKLKKNLKKIWHFIWEEDSLASWIVNIIIAFLVIKFIVYPGLGLVFGTSFPVVAVVSGSMEHDGSFEDWWDSRAVCSRANCRQSDWYNENSITEDEFKTFIFRNGFNTGDIIILFGAKPQNIDVGDVIVFASTRPYPIIHRVVEKQNDDGQMVFETKGDHNPAKGPDDVNIGTDKLIGKAVLRIPYLGYIKIWFFELLYGARDILIFVANFIRGV